jgi:hypothetical protein
MNLNTIVWIALILLTSYALFHHLQELLTASSLIRRHASLANGMRCVLVMAGLLLIAFDAYAIHELMVVSALQESEPSDAHPKKRLLDLGPEKIVGGIK